MTPESAVSLASTLERLSIVALLFVIIIVLAYSLFWARKSATGEKRSSLLLPGWVHDESEERHKRELEAQRTFYQQALTDCQKQSDVRISEFRGARDVALAEAADAKEDRRRLLEAITDSSRDISLLLELQRMANRDGGRTGSSSG